MEADAHVIDANRLDRLVENDRVAIDLAAGLGDFVGDVARRD
jgi:hypothetical protein